MPANSYLLKFKWKTLDKDWSECPNLNTDLKSYNLRSLKKKKDTPFRYCYLENFSKNMSPEALNPKVCLERLKLLDCPDLQTSRFYLEKGKISIKKNKSFLLNRKHLLKLFCIIILALISSLYWRDYMQTYIFGVNKLSEIYPAVQNFYFNIVNFHLNNLKQCSHKEKKINAEDGKSISLDTEEKFYFMQDSSDIRNLIRDYVVEIKSNNNNNKQNITKFSTSFIEEQCSANFTQNFNSTNNNFHSDMFFDLTNLTDYALESQGAKIVSVLNTELYGTLTVKFLNYNLWPVFTNFLMKYFKCFSSNGPNSILIPWKKPGDCWAFKGSYGRIQIQLSEKIVVSAISIDHIPKEIAPNGGIQSAPKKFSIAGIEESETQITRMHWGTYEYKNSGPATQTFFIQPQVKVPFRKIEVIIESNQGNKNYTCVYKIRVHGYK